MASRLPPVPPAGRTDKGTPAQHGPNEAPAREPSPLDESGKNRNLKEQGRQGNIKQNTTNKGYQQDR